MGQVILGVAHQRGKVRGADLLIEVHLDVVHALLHLLAELGVGAAFMDAPDEIIVHHMGKRVQLVQRAGGFRGLDVVVAQRVGLLRREPTLDGGAADQRGEHDDAGLALAQGIVTAHRHARAHAHTGRKRLPVVQIPGAHHLQQALFRHIHLVAVMPGAVHRVGYLGHTLAVDIADSQMLAGQAVVQHQGVAVEDRVLQHRHLLDDFVELHRPRHTDFHLAIVLQALLNAAHRDILIEHRADDPRVL